MPRYPWAVRAGGPLLIGGAPTDPPITFTWNSEIAATLPGTATFTRASVETVSTNTDGTSWDQDAKAGELRLDGERRVEQELTNAEFAGTLGSGAPTSWTLLTGTGTTEVVAGSTNGGVNSVRTESTGNDRPAILSTAMLTIPAGEYVFAVYVEAIDVVPDGLARWGEIQTGNGEFSAPSDQLTLGWNQFRFTVNAAQTPRIRLGIGATSGDNGDVTFSTPIAYQVEDTSGVFDFWVNDNETTNANVDGVGYSNTENANSVDANGVVTEAVGATITDGGYLSETAPPNTNVDVLDTGAVIASAFGALLDITLPASVTGTITLLGPDATAVDIIRVNSGGDVIMDDGGTPTTIGTATLGTRVKISYGRDSLGRSGSLDGATAVTGDAPGAGHEGDTFQIGAANSVAQSKSIHHLTTIYSVRPTDTQLETLSA